MQNEVLFLLLIKPRAKLKFFEFLKVQIVELCARFPKPRLDNRDSLEELLYNQKSNCLNWVLGNLIDGLKFKLSTQTLRLGSFEYLQASRLRLPFLITSSALKTDSNKKKSSRE
ncbi:hypothetical protein BpHYR1_013730 [Brachionus plicatilis]|uniref:Uncharacterized protein n=1 Tax=Brachionus plicatilis TaxID=10195 RepID=A0A3M7PAB8_BRAPC|nr:hypothetical protein BpHYR1_013730 [Brachionus plicatilis]